MAKFFTSDHHLFSEKTRVIQNRNYGSDEEEIDALVAQWNKQVTTTDTVEYLGDFSNIQDYKLMASVLERLNGTINYTMGNWDDFVVLSELRKDGLINEINTLGKSLIINNTLVHLTHYPMSLGPRTNIFNIHGHIHSRPSPFANQINVSVDSPILSYKKDFTLLSEEDAIFLIKESTKIIDYWKEEENRSVYTNDKWNYETNTAR